MSEQARKVAKQICARWFSTDTDSTWARQAIDDIADALAQAQREHAAVRRKVKAMRDHVDPDSLSQFGSGYHKACADLLAWLHERGR